MAKKKKTAAKKKSVTELAQEAIGKPKVEDLDDELEAEDDQEEPEVAENVKTDLGGSRALEPEADEDDRENQEDDEPEEPKSAAHLQKIVNGLRLGNGRLKHVIERNKAKIKELEDTIAAGISCPDMPNLSPYGAKLDWLGNVVTNHLHFLDEATKAQWTKEVNDLKTLFDLLGGIQGNGG
jgi:hypothetical protein